MSERRLWRWIVGLAWSWFDTWQWAGIIRWFKRREVSKDDVSDDFTDRFTLGFNDDGILLGAGILYNGGAKEGFVDGLWMKIFLKELIIDGSIIGIFDGEELGLDDGIKEGFSKGITPDGSKDGILVGAQFGLDDGKREGYNDRATDRSKQDISFGVKLGVSNDERRCLVNNEAGRISDFCYLTSSQGFPSYDDRLKDRDGMIDGV